MSRPNRQSDGEGGAARVFWSHHIICRKCCCQPRSYSHLRTVLPSRQIVTPLPLPSNTEAPLSYQLNGAFCCATACPSICSHHIIVSKVYHIPHNHSIFYGNYFCNGSHSGRSSSSLATMRCCSARGRRGISSSLAVFSARWFCNG